MEKITSLKDLLIEQVRELYNSEYQQLYFLTNTIVKVEHKTLKLEILNHIKETQEQIKRLKNILNQLFVSSLGEHSEIMTDFINEANDLIARSDSPKIRDVVIITCIQYMKHFEIAIYGSAYAYAEEFGRRDIADQLYTSLIEEKDFDNLLSNIAVEQLNSRAKNPIIV